MRFKQFVSETKGAFDAASKVNCPLCGAKANEGCVGKVGSKNEGQKLSTLHNERLRAAGFGSAKDFNAKTKAIPEEDSSHNRRHANLMKWFGKSLVRKRDGSPFRVFHGSSNDISDGVFRPSSKGVYGPGIYFTSNSGTASGYASGKRRMVNGTAEVKGNVLPVFLKIERAFTNDTLHSNLAFKKELLKLIKPGGVFGAFKKVKDQNTADLIHQLEDNSAKVINVCYCANSVSSLTAPIFELIRKHFDGIAITDSAGGADREFVVFSSNQVKSAVGNNGEYSSSKSINEQG